MKSSAARRWNDDRFDVRHAHPSPPGRRTDEVLALLDAELSRRARLGYLAVMLAGLVVTGLVAALWATEPGLPLRTHLSFAGIVLLGTGWVAVAGYVLTRRRPLYAADRVLATGMAVTATSAGGVGVTVVAGLRGGALAAATAAVPAAMLLGIAAVLHVRARARRRALLARRRELTGLDGDGEVV